MNCNTESDSNHLNMAKEDVPIQIFALFIINFIWISSQICVLMPWFMSETKVWMIVLVVLFNLDVLMLLYCYYLSWSTEVFFDEKQIENIDRDSNSAKKEEEEEALSNSPREDSRLLDSTGQAVDTTKRRYCKRCEQQKPIRAHHCSACERCVLKMDHHCKSIILNLQVQ